jgi:hypothetical protein
MLHNLLQWLKGMTRLTAVKRKIEKLGGTLHNNSTPKVWDYSAEAPHGMVWAASGTHELVLNQHKGHASWLDDAVTDLQERVEMGVVDCDDPDCDWCNN